MTLEGVSGKPSVDIKAVDVKSLLQSLKALQQNKEQDRYGSLNNQYNAQQHGYKKQYVGNRQQYYDRYTKQKNTVPDYRPVFDESVDFKYVDDDDKDVSNDVIKVLDRKPYKQNSVYKQKLFNAKALKDLFSLNRAKPSSLLGSEDVLDLDKYSRIYVVLNPQALKQDKNVADL